MAATAAATIHQPHQHLHLPHQTPHVTSPSIISLTLHHPPFPSSSSISRCSSLTLRHRDIASFLGFIPKRRRCECVVVRAAKGDDYYSTLNLSRDASLDEIKSSYRKLARKYHPDMNKTPGAEEKFKEISAAYEVLSDNEKRSVYDRYGEAGLQGEYDGSNFQQSEVDPFQVFDAIFGDGNGFFGVSGQGGEKFNMRSRGTNDLDIRHDISLSFEESVFGGQREVEVSCLDTCDACGGSGAKSSSSVKTCNDCGGRGGIQRTQRTPFGIISQMSTCPKCDGNGKTITDRCRRCGGNGRTKAEHSISVEIPPGVDDGAMMRIQGEGNYDNKRSLVGDLYLVIRVEEKNGIWKEGLNLYSKVTVDFTEAILGTVAKVETVEGLKDIRIPPGTQPGDRLKLRSMGIPNKKNSKRGDHVVIVNVQVPKRISETERALIEELASLRASSREYVFRTDDSTNRNQSREREEHFSRKKEKLSSLWNSIKDFLRQKYSSCWGSSKKGFASLSLQMPLPLSKCPSHYPSMPLWSVVFLVTCIFASIAHVGLSTLRRRKDQDHPRRICQDKH